MTSVIRFVEITYFPAVNAIHYRVEKARASETTLTGIEKYHITYTEKTVPKTIINYVSNAKYALTWDTTTEHKSCVVSNSKVDIENIKEVYSRIDYFSNLTIEER